MTINSKLTHALMTALAMSAFLLSTSSLCASPLGFDVGDQVAKLTLSPGGFADFFGFGVDISGSTVIVSAADPLTQDAPTVHLFDAITGLELAELVPLDGATNKFYGLTVAISGTRAVASAINDSQNGFIAGAVYLFDVNTGLQLLKLFPNDPAISQAFGTSVAMDGTSIVIGAEGDNTFGARTGAAYVFDSLSGQQLLKLLAVDGAGGDALGHAIAVDGALAAVGASGVQDVAPNGGAVYVFDTTTGQQVSKFTPSDAQPNDFLGDTVAIHGTTVLAGLSRRNVAYVFDALSGQELRTLTPDASTPTSSFANSVALDGNLAIVGAICTRDANNDSFGALFVFDVTTGQQLAKLVADDPTNGDTLGLHSVAIDGDLTVGGAPGDTENGFASGAAIVFDLTLPLATATARNGSGVNANILTSITNPILGQNWDVDLDASGHAPGLAMLEVYVGQLSGLFLPGGEVLIDLSSSFAARFIQAHGGNLTRISAPIPSDSTLCGFAASVQGVVLGAPDYEFSNAIDVVLGY